MILLLEFLICSALIFFSSYQASSYGKALAGKMNWHEAFIGVFFLAFATSLPEVSTSVSSIVATKTLNLGFGNAIGSVIINSMVLSGLIIYLRVKVQSLIQYGKGNIFTGLLSLMALALLLIVSFFRLKGFSGFKIFNIGGESILILFAYYIGIRILVKGRHDANITSWQNGVLISWIRFAIPFFVIIALGIWLADIGKRISDATAVNQSFVGSLALAFTTSLPEIAVTWSSFRIGSVSMAVGNIFGSNFFDVCIIPFMDIFYIKGPVLSLVEPINVFMVCFAAGLTSVMIIGFFLRAKYKKLSNNWAMSLVLILGLVSYYCIYKFG